MNVSSEPPMSDVFDQVFRLIRLEACVYFQRDFHAPWAMQIGPTKVAQFHLVSSGSCVIERDKDRTVLGAGDIVLFPRGTAHVIADKEGRPAVPGQAAMATFGTAQPMFSGPGDETRVICGHYCYRDQVGHPLMDSLPEMLLLRRSETSDLTKVADLLIAETMSGVPGSTPIIERLAEVLLVHILRAWIAQETRPPGFLNVMTDPRLCRAMVRIHSDFQAPLTLEALAEEAGMSRSNFAVRFKQVTGLAAIEYLSKWRMISAGDLLSETGLSIADIAARSGYGSDLAFARAFKREYGLSPASWRRQSRVA